MNKTFEKIYMQIIKENLDEQGDGSGFQILHDMENNGIKQQNIANHKGEYKNFTGQIDWHGTKGYVKDAYFSLNIARWDIPREIVFERGSWLYGTAKGVYWEDGNWYDGIWGKGTWLDGVWIGGTWKDGDWHNGYWRGGTWENGYWYDGTWEKGYWKNGQWYDGEWENGHWQNGIWWHGTWNNGVWCNGTWENGEWIIGMPDPESYDFGDDIPKRKCPPNTWDKLAMNEQC